MTTDDPIELTTNLHQSIQPIGNHYIFANNGNMPCSGRVYSYILSLTFDSQQVRHRTKFTMPLATSCRLIKEQQVLNSPYILRLFIEGGEKQCALVACSVHVAHHSLPSVAFRTLPARRLLPSSPARWLARSFTPLPSLPSLPPFPTQPVDAPLAPLRDIPGYSTRSPLL
jgi:hypothetical protein